jgi:serine/threonine protein kinase
MAKLSTSEFVDYLSRSDLVPEDVLKHSLDDLRRKHGGKLPDDAEIVADHLVDSQLITRWHADKIFEKKYKGFRLGKYKILSLLGSGQMSSVYLAEHVLMKRLRAVKVFPKSLLHKSSYLARFHSGAQATISLDHPNIVRAFDVDNDGEQHFLVMEYVDGKDAQEIVKRSGPLPLELACNFIAQTAEGIAYAHANNLIYCHLKPTSLLIDDKGIVRILDMELALYLDGDKSSINEPYDEIAIGTADYLAPEQAINGHSVVDPRSDIYSLGCILYFLLTGHPPFPNGTLVQKIANHQTTMPADIRKDRPDCPRDLVDICIKMLRKDPKFRYQTMLQVSEALRAWLIHHGFRFESSKGTVTMKAAALKRSKISERILQSHPKKSQPASSPTFPAFPLPGREISMSRFLIPCLVGAIFMAAIAMLVFWLARNW